MGAMEDTIAAAPLGLLWLVLPRLRRDCGARAASARADGRERACGDPEDVQDEAIDMCLSALAHVS